jgi:hypothetical protein
MEEIMKLFFTACTLIAATACVTALATGGSGGAGRSTLERQRRAADEILAHVIRSGSRSPGDAAALVAATPDLSSEERLELQHKLVAITENRARPLRRMP